MHTFFRIKKYINYWLDAVDEHSLHSPFLYDFFTRIVKPKKDLSEHSAIEQLRKKLLHDERVITVDDLGNGSSSLTGNVRKISDIAKTSLSPQSFSILYSRIISHYNARNVIELGTSLGINTLYLASGKKAHVTTFEGSSAIADIATLTFEFAQAKNINLVLGNIENTLPAFLQSSGKIDVAFIDANHRYEPTRRYFEWLVQRTHSQSVIILDDIYFSPEMERAWIEIKKHSMVYTTIDLYRCGLVFFDPSLNKQHVVLQY